MTESGALSMLERYAPLRQEIREAVDAGNGHGLFSPIFVDIYDALKEVTAAHQQDAQRIAQLEAQLAFQRGELIEKQKYILQLERSIPVPGQSAHPMTDETYKTIFTILTDYRSKVDTNSMWALFHPEKSAATCERIDAALAWLEAQKETPHAE